jgi:hypothetical protein
MRYAKISFDCSASIVHGLSTIPRAFLVFSYVSIYMVFRVDKVVAEEGSEPNRGMYFLLVSKL